MSGWKVAFVPEAAKELKKLGPGEAALILRTLEERITPPSRPARVGRAADRRPWRAVALADRRLPRGRAGRGCAGGDPGGAGGAPAGGLSVATTHTYSHTYHTSVCIRLILDGVGRIES